MIMMTMAMLMLMMVMMMMRMMLMLMMMMLMKEVWDLSHHNLVVVRALSASHCLKFPSFSSLAACSREQM